MDGDLPREDESARAFVTSSPEPLLSAKEVAAWLNTTTGGLAQLRFRGEGPPYVKLGRTVRYQASDVRAWLDDNKRQR